MQAGFDDCTAGKERCCREQPVADGGASVQVGTDVHVGGMQDGFSSSRECAVIVGAPLPDLPSLPIHALARSKTLSADAETRSLELAAKVKDSQVHMS